VGDDQREPQHRDGKSDRKHRNGVLDVGLHRPILLKPALSRSLIGEDYGRPGLPGDYPIIVVGMATGAWCPKHAER
jgi:hypothetical protein